MSGASGTCVGRSGDILSLNCFGGKGLLWSPSSGPPIVADIPEELLTLVNKNVFALINFSPRCCVAPLISDPADEEADCYLEAIRQINNFIEADGVLFSMSRGAQMEMRRGSSNHTDPPRSKTNTMQELRIFQHVSDAPLSATKRGNESIK